MSCQALRFVKVQTYSNVRLHCIELLENPKAKPATTLYHKSVNAAKAEKMVWMAQG